MADRLLKILKILFYFMFSTQQKKMQVSSISKITLIKKKNIKNNSVPKKGGVLFLEKHTKFEIFFKKQGNFFKHFFLSEYVRNVLNNTTKFLFQKSICYFSCNLKTKNSPKFGQKGNGRNITADRFYYFLKVKKIQKFSISQTFFFSKFRKDFKVISIKSTGKSNGELWSF